MLKTGFMKKALFIGLLSLGATGIIGVAPVSAKGHLDVEYKNHHNRRTEKRQAWQVFHRTQDILEQAQQMAGHRGSRHHNGIRHRGLGRAFAYQHRAHELFRDGDYENTIYLSLRSRAIALRVIRRMRDWDNSDSWRDDNYDYNRVDLDRNDMDDTERDYWSHRPDDNTLDLEIKGHDIDDDTAIKFRISADL